LIRGQFARQQFLAAHVRFGSLPDIHLPSAVVRFTPESGHWLRPLGCPLCAKSGHSELRQKMMAVQFLLNGSGGYYTPSWLMGARCVEQLPGESSIRVQ
jgi:hypothetical protein